jgi:dTDP-L-rhamnose 4-epimerase
MSSKIILVTGGAGFIGSHLVDALVAQGHTVRVLDSLVTQVHGPDAKRPAYLPDGVEFIQGDVRDIDILAPALQGVEVIFHLAAEVGVGQSMYEVVRYVDSNTTGTALLLETIIQGGYAVKKLIVASSMSIYGEGAYNCDTCGRVYPQLRSNEQLIRREWEMRCPKCNRVVQPLPTPESKPPFPTSIYAITKMGQELMCRSIGRAYGIPTIALRYFNVYGPRQALSNPYTGVVAIFITRLLNSKPPLVFEDGLQSRDFIHVSDIVQASLLAMDKDIEFGVFNIGTGYPLTVLDVAHALAENLGVDIQPQIVNRFRVGDIRHCYADITRARTMLGYEPQVRFEDGIADIVAWGREQQAIDRVEQATAELERRGLTW